ncbi:MAG: FGGY family carbohydrate kinase [Alphaproteobacteria bacterium]|nr:FGGY family carbohydrate kinase [Alphaproteobacteria bacterium]
MSDSQSGAALIGVDIGTGSVKALMCSADGALLDAYASGHETARPAPGAAEQDPADWLRHVEAALARFAAHPRAGDVAAIGVTSQVNTHVFCDANYTPLRPAMTWQDTRPAAAAARLDSTIDPDAKTAALGAPIPIDASHALARMAWMAEYDPALWAATAYVLLPKDFVVAQLTGEAGTDPISAVGLVGPDLRYASPVLDLTPRAEALLPPLADPLEIAGRVAPGRPFAGAPVTVGLMDAWASMFGLGVAGEGQAMYLSGTSEVLGLISQSGAGAPGVIRFPDWRGITLHAGPTQSGGASLLWLARIMGRDIDALSVLAAEARITAQSPLFLPHLEGERAPLWDAQSRGAFAGLTSAAGPTEIVASVMEGVAFAARLALEAIEVSGARPAPRLRYGGGGAASDIWGQIRANALGRVLERASAPQAGAMGATVMAGVASGLVPDLEGATRDLVATDRVFEPDPEAAALAEDRFTAYQDLYRTMGPVNRRLDPTERSLTT